jgi:hypothetical protein
MENVGPTSSLSFLIMNFLMMEFSKVLSRNWLMLDPSKMLSILVEQWKLLRWLLPILTPQRMILFMLTMSLHSR